MIELFTALSLLFLFGISSLTAFNSSLVTLGSFRAKEFFRTKGRLRFFFHFCTSRFFPLRSLYFALSFSKYALILLYTSFTYILLSLFVWPSLHEAIVVSIIVIFSLTIDYCMRILSEIWPRTLLLFASPTTSLILFLLFPLIKPLDRLIKYLSSKLKIEELFPKHFLLKDKIMEMVQDSGLSELIDVNNQKILTSLIAFKEREAREIMVPRVNIFALEATDSVKKASKLFLTENYSRIPVYKGNLDNIIGILMYKDLLRVLLQNETETPIGKFVKPVLYAPENKSIAQLFQEFKNKQIHLAIIVNEYGGTEGIVTIEDILEQLVGEIEDEYDIGEKQFCKLPNGNFIVDAKMNIVDAENQIGIKIPYSSEYETIGGFVFHKAGTIPFKGWTIHLDDFDLEVISSNDRAIEKIRIKPKPPIAKDSLLD